MKTRLTELLHIQYPIIQGAMAWVSTRTLVASVANAGATGVIASGGRSGEWLREEIKKTKALTDKPFGVNLMLMAPNIAEIMDVIIEEKPHFVTMGAGNPIPYFSDLKSAGILCIPVVPNAKLAKRVEEKGADALIIEGMEAGGHIGKQTSMALAENVIPNIDIPVILAGGIADGRGLAAALTLGASGVQMGSRFILAKECAIHENCKTAIIAATDTDSVVTGLLHGHAVRGLYSKFAEEYLELEREGASYEVLSALATGTNKRAAIDGDIVHGLVQAGQSLIPLKEILPAQSIIQSTIQEAKEALQKAAFYAL